MRHFYRYTRTYSVTIAKFQVVSIGMSSLTTAANRRDVFARVMYRSVSGKNNLYLTKTLAEAEAISTELTTDGAKDDAGVFGYHENFTLDSTSRTFTYTNHTDVTPNMTGISIAYSGDGDTSNWDAVFGCDAAPEAVVLEEIEYLLERRTTSGQALAGYSSASIQRGAFARKILSHSPSILAASVSAADAPSTNRAFSLDLNYSVVVGMLGTDAGGPAGTSALLRDAGQVRSILGDEHRTLSNLVSEISIGNIEGPTEMEGEGEAYIAMEITGLARVHAMQSDE